MTDTEILAYMLTKNKSATMREVASFRRVMFAFDCEDAKTPQEAQKKILASLDLLEKQYDEAPTLEEGALILRQGLSKLPRNWRP